MKKKIVFMLCVISCMMLVAGCTLVSQNENFDESELKTNAETFVSSWFSYDFASTVEEYEDQLTSDQVEQYKEYAKLQESHGEMKEIAKTEYSTSTDSATVTETVSTKKGSKLVFTMTYDENGEISDWKVEEYQTIGDTIGKAILNTIMCMAIVFAVLIFISLIIACFKFIGNIGGNSGKKEIAEREETVQETVNPAVEENLIDDLELVAVITAAITASSEKESTDGLVVRSIVRRS